MEDALSRARACSTKSCAPLMPALRSTSRAPGRNIADDAPERVEDHAEARLVVGAVVWRGRGDGCEGKNGIPFSWGS